MAWPDRGHGCNFGATRAADLMIIVQPDGLHPGIDDNRPGKFVAAFFKGFGECDGTLGLGGSGSVIVERAENGGVVNE